MSDWKICLSCLGTCTKKGKDGCLLLYLHMLLAARSSYYCTLHVGTWSILLFPFRVSEHILWGYILIPASLQLDSSAFTTHSLVTSTSDQTLSHINASLFWPILFLLFLLTLTKLLQGKNTLSLIFPLSLNKESLSSLMPPIQIVLVTTLYWEKERYHVSKWRK